MKKSLLFIMLTALTAPVVLGQSEWAYVECFQSLGSTVQSPTSLQNSDVYLDRNGKPWVSIYSQSTTRIGTTVNGIWTYWEAPDPEGLPFPVPTTQHEFASVVFDNNNDLWVTTAGFSRSLYRLSGGNWQFITSTANVNEAMMFENDNNIYIRFDHMVRRFHPSSSGFMTTLYQQPSAGTTPIRAMAKRSDGELALYKRGNESDTLVIVSALGQAVSYDISGLFQELGGTQFRSDLSYDSEGRLFMYLSTGYVHTIVEFDGGEYTYYQMDTPASMPDAMCNNMVMENDTIHLFYDRHLVTFRNGEFSTDNVMNAPSWNTFGRSKMNFRRDAAGNTWYIGRIPPVGEYVLCVLNPHGLNTFQGRTFIDWNQNGVFDSGDEPVSMAVETPTGYTLANALGTYNVFGFDPSQQMTVAAVAPQYFEFTTPDSYTFTPVSDPAADRDFGIYPMQEVQDLRVSHTSTACRPGFNVTQWVSYGNHGTLTTDATVRFVYDPQLTFVSASPEPDEVDGNVLIWERPQLAPFANGTVQANFTLGADASIQDTLFGSVTIDPVDTDHEPSDNEYAAVNPITGSYDPNDKTATPTDIIWPDTWLDYRVRFQNTGNDTAFNVYILDTLSSFLDLGSLAVTGYSHPARYALTGNLLEFWFDDILLPDTFTNEPLSHGFFHYRIRTKDNMVPGDAVYNTAYIYFDFNQPIITNTTVNTVPEPNHVQQMEQQGPWTVFPNPTEGSFQLQSHAQMAGPLDVVLYDLQGRAMMRQQWTDVSGIKTVNTSQCASGFYLLEIIAGGQRTISRVVLR
jgi:uncharacterized repeat protein (TIGR01451 family)